MTYSSKLIQKKEQIPVEIRCVFVKICQVDTVNEVYYADIFLQSKWREPLLDNSLDSQVDLKNLWNPKLFVENLYKENQNTTSLEVYFPDGKDGAYVIEKRRINGTFHETLELKQFPFDCQDLSITVSSECSIEEVDLLESKTDLSTLNVSSEVESQEWNIHSHVEVSTMTVVTNCNIGPQMQRIIVFTCRASRRFRYFLINHILISVMLCLLTFCSFAVVPTNTHGRLQLCMIILLTTVTFKVAVSQNLPKIPYLTYLDKAILGNIFVIMCLCLWHALTSIFFLNQNLQKSKIENIRKIECFIIPILLTSYIMAIFVFGLAIYFDAGKRRRLMKLKDLEFGKKLKSCKKEDYSELHSQ